MELFKKTQDREYEKAVDNLAKKFDSKLDKVHEHHKSMQKYCGEEINMKNDGVNIREKKTRH